MYKGQRRETSIYMKMINQMFKQIRFLIAVIGIFTLSACGDDDDNNQEEIDVYLGCCSPDPVFGPNVDNLDQSQGEIKVANIFTPNGDAYHDALEIEHINLYDNHTVSIYTDSDELIFESGNYNTAVIGGEFFPNVEQGENGAEGIPDGTYKYKIVVENEQIFMESGTFCLFTNYQEVDQNFSECNPLENGFDPIISGN